MPGRAGDGRKKRRHVMAGEGVKKRERLRVLYESGKPSLGASAFVALTSTVLVSSPVWVSECVIGWTSVRSRSCFLKPHRLRRLCRRRSCSRWPGTAPSHRPFAQGATTPKIRTTMPRAVDPWNSAARSTPGHGIARTSLGCGAGSCASDGEFLRC